MKPSQALASHRDAIRHVVESHRAGNARVFGSVVRGDDTEDSDLDILIDPTPETTLLDIGAIRHELLQLLGMPVDVLTPKALPEKFRATVLAKGMDDVTFLQNEMAQDAVIRNLDHLRSEPQYRGSLS